MNDAEIEFLSALHQRAVRLRGAYLDQAIWIDVFLSNLLAEYFCQNASRRQLFFSEVMSSGEFRFVAKIKLLRNILKHFEPAAGNKFPTLVKQLEAIMRLRNKLAHSHLDTSLNVIAARQLDRVRFLYYDTGATATIEFTEADVKERLCEASDVANMLLALMHMMIPGAKQPKQSA